MIVTIAVAILIVILVRVPPLSVPIVLYLRYAHVLINNISLGAKSVNVNVKRLSTLCNILYIYFIGYNC